MKSADGLLMHDRTLQENSLDKDKEVVISEHVKSGDYRTVLKGGLDNKAVLTELFLVECETNFDDLSMKSKLAKIARCGDCEFRNYMVELGINDVIPQEYVQLKQKVLDFCLSKDLTAIKRFTDEPWSNFIGRLQGYSQKNNLKESEVIKRLRDIWIPEKYQTLVHGIEPDLSEVIKEYENGK
ncbi:hypothetical protein EDEG_02797 [Edhazardia aedis USNM 41457]|uniref:Uncharacterized protein n=1 Tax=Edhazardia aedis (strain USNM 41457) TaxID=1003232 RepID=J8ZT26_EDHAE|nr:hypothetical protein EDEG_02797 [Edhazardia aedis USNM 41457]|eukprot:EJW02823.1 hypothetical protein EDEG_02797 [Edhazardia aedis USNM 41457]